MARFYKGVFYCHECGTDFKNPEDRYIHKCSMKKTHKQIKDFRHQVDVLVVPSQ